MDTGISDDELAKLERQMLRAIDARSLDGLDVLGFGEMAVALSWTAGPTPAVIKRVASVESEADAETIVDSLNSYVAALEPHVRVAPTDVRVIRNDQGRSAIYMIQPQYPSSTLLEHMLSDTTPRSDHPIVVAVRDAVLAVTESGNVGIDAQFSNFAWIDDELVLFDVGTPFLFDDNGRLTLDPRIVVRVMPAVVRPLVARRFQQIVAKMGSRQGGFEQAAASLVRLGEEQWLDAVLESFAPHLTTPVDRDAVVAKAESLHSDSRGLKKLLVLERFWSTKVRRRPFDVFITDSFTGELL